MKKPVNVRVKLILDPEIKKSLPTKLTACGFIAITLAGNFWLVGLALNQPPHWTVSFLFFSGVVASLLGGLGLAYLIVRKYIKKG